MGTLFLLGGSKTAGFGWFWWVFTNSFLGGNPSFETKHLAPWKPIRAPYSPTTGGFWKPFKASYQKAPCGGRWSIFPLGSLGCPFFETQSTWWPQGTIAWVAAASIPQEKRLKSSPMWPRSGKSQTQISASKRHPPFVWKLHYVFSSSFPLILPRLITCYPPPLPAATWHMIHSPLADDDTGASFSLGLGMMVPAIAEGLGELRRIKQLSYQFHWKNRSKHTNQTYYIYKKKTNIIWKRGRNLIFWYTLPCPIFNRSETVSIELQDQLDLRNGWSNRHKWKETEALLTKQRNKKHWE